MAQSSIPIIVTRAEPGAQETVQRLNARGLPAVLAPMLSLKVLPDVELPAASTLSGLIFTSANGVRTYADQRRDRDLPAWCVGPATAAAARESGFSDIRESAGNAKDLAVFIANGQSPTVKPLLHVANAAAAGQLQRDLEQRGYSIAFAPLYEMRASPALPEAVRALIDAHAPAILLVHSAKGAAATASHIPALPTNWLLVAISAQAAAPLLGLTTGRTYLADAPNEDGLMRALDDALATLSA